jgi:hypothetical protein
MLAQGKYIKIQCSDDFLHEQCLEVIHSFIEESNSIYDKPFYLGHEMFAGTSVDLANSNFFSKIVIDKSNFFESSLAKGIATGLPNICVNTAYFKEFGGFGTPNSSQDFSRDLLMLGLFSVNCNCYQSNLCLVFERAHDTQNRYSMKKQWQLNEMYKLYNETKLFQTVNGKLKIKQLAGMHLASSIKFLIKKRSFSYLFHTLKFSISNKLVGVQYFKSFFSYLFRKLFKF